MIYLQKISLHNQHEEKIKKSMYIKNVFEKKQKPVDMILIYYSSLLEYYRFSFDQLFFLLSTPLMRIVLCLMKKKKLSSSSPRPRHELLNNDKRRNLQCCFQKHLDESLNQKKGFSSSDKRLLFFSLSLSCVSSLKSLDDNVEIGLMTSIISQSHCSSFFFLPDLMFTLYLDDR